MTAWTWAVLGLALLLIPLGDPVSERLQALRVRGRLVSPRSHARPAQWAGFTPTATAAPALGCGVLLVVTVRAGPVLGVAAGLVAATGAQLFAAAVRGRALERSAASLLAAVRLVAAEVAAGAPPDAALRAAAEVDPSRR